MVPQPLRLSPSAAARSPQVATKWPILGDLHAQLRRLLLSADWTDRNCPRGSRAINKRSSQRPIVHGRCSKRGSACCRTRERQSRIGRIHCADSRHRPFGCGLRHSESSISDSRTPLCTSVARRCERAQCRRHSQPAMVVLVLSVECFQNHLSLPSLAPLLFISHVRQ